MNEDVLSSLFLSIILVFCSQGEPGLSNTNLMKGRKGEPGFVGPQGLFGNRGIKGNPGPIGTNG